MGKLKKHIENFENLTLNLLKLTKGALSWIGFVNPLNGSMRSLPQLLQLIAATSEVEHS